MLSFLILGLFCLTGIGRAQMDPGCVATSLPSATVLPTTVSSCTLFFTPSMPPQIGPTSTVYATMMTTQFNVVNCNYCAISNVAQNPVATGPFTTKITSDYLLITQIACLGSGPSLLRRNAMPDAAPEPTALYIRGAKPQTVTPIIRKKEVAVSMLVDHLKRQAPTDTTSTPLVLTGQAFQLIEQLFTVLFSIGVINSGVDLGESCLQLQSANAVLDLAQVGLNATQAAAIVCTASLPDSDLASFNQNLIASAAAALFGVQLAAKFTGTTDTGKLCTQLDLSPLPALGVDTDAIQTLICKANNATNATNATSITTSAPTHVPSAGTLTPFPFTNSSGGSFTWVGSITATGPVGTAVTAPWGTDLPASGTGFYPTGNHTSIGATASGSAVAGTGELPAGTGIVGNGTAISSISSAPTGTTSIDKSTAISGNATLPTQTGSAGNGTAVSGTGGLPLGTGTVGNGTTVSGTGDLPSATDISGSGIGVNGTSINGSSTLPAGTGSIENGTVISAAGNLPAATGNTGPGIEINGTNTRPSSVDTGIAGATATGDAWAGYASSTVDAASSQGGGGYGQGTTAERVPRGPTSTPRYYLKYF